LPKIAPELRFRLRLSGGLGYLDRMSDPAPAALADLPFEKAMQELEQIVAQLERGDVPLERSIEIYERGDKLRRHCAELLAKAELKVEVITQAADGRPVGTRPLDVA
jgi:exodeoxyribonuclease VII small subunit